MGKLILHRADLHLKGHDLVTRGNQWLQKWDPYLDRLEEFATNVGVDRTQRLLDRARQWDRGLLAMGGGLIALMALALAG